MMNLFPKIYVGALLFITAIVVVSFTTGVSKTPEAVAYYLDSKGGSDTNNGKSPRRAWKSFARLNETRLNPGDIIRFKRGAQFEGLLTIKYSGAPGNYITLTDYGNKADSAPGFTNKVFKQDNFGNCIRVKGSYVIVENLYFHNTPVYKPGDYETGGGWPQWEMGAIYIDKGAKHCIVRNNETFDCPVGIKSYGEHALIEYNYVHDCNRVLAEWDWGPIGIWLGADFQEVRYNKIVNYRAENPQIRWNGADGGAMEVDDARYDKSHISIHHNYSRDCQGFLEMTYKDVKTAPRYENFLIHHNISDDYQDFILLWQGADFKIENNTIIRRKRNSNDRGVFHITQSDSRNLISNNIIVVEKDIPVFFTAKKNRNPNPIIRNNLYYAASGSLDFGREGPGISPVFGDPGLINYAMASEPGDYSINKGSAAIDKGLTLGYRTDFIGTSIPQQSGVDIGAFEYK